MRLSPHHHQQHQHPRVVQEQRHHAMPQKGSNYRTDGRLLYKRRGSLQGLREQKNSYTFTHQRKKVPGWGGRRRGREDQCFLVGGEWEKERGDALRDPESLYCCFVLPSKKAQIISWGFGKNQQQKGQEPFAAAAFKHTYPPACVCVCLCGSRYRDSVSVGREAETGRHISLPSWQPGQSVCMKPPVTHLL